MIDRKVYDMAKVVLAKQGEPVPVKDILDPWVESARRWSSGRLDLLWMKQLAFTDAGHMLTTRRIIVSYHEDELLMGSSLAVDDGAESVVLDYIEAEDQTGGSFVYDPGEWIQELVDAYRVVAR